MANMNKKEELPDDTVILERRGSWEICYSKLERAVLVTTADYHPGILKLTAKDLRHFCEIVAK
ncbi:MAG: hypothetical protein ACLP29_12460 [Dissulfurispiraceae bacterium]